MCNITLAWIRSAAPAAKKIVRSLGLIAFFVCCLFRYNAGCPHQDIEIFKIPPSLDVVQYTPRLSSFCSTCRMCCDKVIFKPKFFPPWFSSVADRTSSFYSAAIIQAYLQLEQSSEPMSMLITSIQQISRTSRDLHIPYPPARISRGAIANWVMKGITCRFQLWKWKHRIKTKV